MKNILQFDEFNEDGKHALCSWREKRKEKFQHAKSGSSCFICGNDSLVKELENGTFEEVKDALEVCFSMMDISAFQCVSSMRNVSMLAARPKQ